MLVCFGLSVLFVHLVVCASVLLECMSVCLSRGSRFYCVVCSVGLGWCATLLFVCLCLLLMLLF